MPQQPQAFNPSEFGSGQSFDPNEFAQPASKPALTSPVESSWYDDVASYIPQPVKSAWDTIWNPLSDLPSRAASAISEPLMSYGESGSDWTRKPALYGGAFAQSVGDVVSGLTSPGNLALTAATGGAGLARGAALPRVAQAMTTASRVTGGATALHGATLAADPNADWMQRGMGALEMVGGGLAAKAPKPRVVKGAGALEDLSVRQPAASIEPSAVTPESMPVRPPEVANAKPNLRANLDGTFTDTSNAQIFDRAGNPVKPFDPATLQGLEPAPKPVMQFADPKTGEIRPAAQARPGDIPITPSPADAGTYTLEAQRQQMIDLTQERMPTTKEGMTARLDAERRKSSGESPTGTERRTTGEVRGSTLAPEMATANDAPVTSPKLPQNLAGAKPRFNAGTQFYNPQFESDLDKALYIIAQTRKSTHDARYLKFVMDHTGLDESGAQALGREVKATVRAAAKNTPGGDIQIPSIAGKMRFPKTGVSTAGDVKAYLEGKPQVSTGPIEPANVRPAAEVVESLQQRLQRAVDNPDPTSAPQEISKLLDEAAEVLAKDPAAKEAGLVRQVLGANKALLTAWDLSAPGRQGKAFMLNKAWWTSLDDMVKAWGSKEAAHNINQSILDHPSGYFKRPVSETGKVGKSFADEIGLDLAAHEEMFTGVVERVGAKIPLVQRSSRAHTAFLNKLRSDQFVSMMKASKEVGLNPETDMRLGKAYAKFINDATGRGSVNIGKWKLERNVNTLNDVFFAPKNMSGQIRTWNAVLNPIKYYNADPVLRKQALKSLFAVAGLGLGVGEVARMGGAKVSNDPTSADFRKIKIGDTRIDPFGGYQQFPVAAMKLLLGQSTSSTSGKTTDLTAGKWGQTTRASVAERFFINRLSPAGSFIYSWMSTREFDGKTFEAKRALYERVFPIAAKDIWEMAQEDPALAAMLGPTTLMGLTGTQTYTGR